MKQCIKCLIVATITANTAFAEYQIWDVEYNADTLPDSTCISDPWDKHISGTGFTEVVNNSGILSIDTRGNTDHKDMVYYTRDIYPNENDKMIVEAGIKQNSYIGGTNSVGTYYGATSIRLGNGLKDESLIIGPDRIQLFGSQLSYDWQTGEGSDKFHVYRIEAEGNDVRVYVDGVLKIDGTGTFGSNWWEPLNKIQFGEKTGYASGYTEWDFMRYRIE